VDAVQKPAEVARRSVLCGAARNQADANVIKDIGSVFVTRLGGHSCLLRDIGGQ